MAQMCHGGRRSQIAGLQGDIVIDAEIRDVLMRMTVRERTSAVCHVKK